MPFGLSRGRRSKKVCGSELIAAARACAVQRSRKTSRRAIPGRGSNYCAAEARRRSDRSGDEHRPSRRRDSAEESAGWFAPAPGALRSIPLQADLPVANVLAWRPSRAASILGAVVEFYAREFCRDEWRCATLRTLQS